jgi:hypothetical protein
MEHIVGSHLDVVGTLKIAIPRTELANEGGAQFTVFVIAVSTAGTSWNLKLRYSKLEALYSGISGSYTGPAFPAKTW